jgi:hypothetical protein
MADVELSTLGSVIKTAYEGETDTNAFTDAEKTKLSGIETGAEANVVTSVATKTGNVVLAAADITSGTFADARIAQNNVTQHEAALTILTSQITGFTEAIDDQVNTLLVGGTNVTLTYNDAANTLTIDATGSGGAASLDELSDVDATVASPSDGDILVYRAAGGDWVLEAKPAGGSNPAINDITDITITSVADNEVLAYNSGSGEWINQTAAEAGLAAVSHTHATTDITSGTFADARIAQSNVTQHQAALSITESQISDLGTYANASHTHATTDITSGTFADARIAQSNVTQHQAALNITESQISDLASYVDSDPTGVTGADAVTNMMSLTQAEYDAIGTPDTSTFYIITDAT